MLKIESCLLQMWLLAFCVSCGSIPSVSVAFSDATSACEKGDLKKCTALASYYEKGIGTEKNLYRAVTLYRKACEGEHGQACATLGDLYFVNTHRESYSDSKGYQEAIRLFKQACKTNSFPHCLEVDDGYWYQQISDHGLDHL